ncbi:MAG: Asp-tRNA(Asn)/Glu-tRNA(Gln) amidotransferase subunit GatB [Fibromonadaceae bacterium]|jgi:aspartyl-tRNA(Asn)/glutamyl-tRNA(Gln) amidotransferase subunit B|nr:Asp-tRNA(Asn)/Glu-tRNA(Gln) amidotransferase subunit GatB [Fibromonadaceae bacterium]
MPYFPVIGLEVHCQLATKTKLFCGCEIEVNTEPNKRVCPGCLGLPGTLPVPNKEAVKLAIKLGLALNCEIDTHALWTRKNYFYPDLPKGYQITQTGAIPAHDHPICKKGYIEITSENGEKKRIGINRIHIEEDAGKLVHDFSPENSHFDANRCGTPLCEIVTEPDIRSPEDAVLVLQKIKQILEYTGVSNANMENGNMRCDGNISIRKSEDAPFGTRAEIKNLNSFSNLQKALEAEMALQAVTLDSGKEVEQCTKRYDANHNKTIVIRSKEDSHDYKYFPDPDLLRLVIDKSLIDSIRKSLPELPDLRRSRFESDFGLNAYDAQVLTADKEISDWFDLASKTCKNPKLLANWVTSELMRELKEMEGGISTLKFKAEDLAEMVNLIENNTISGKIGKTVFAEMLATGKDPNTIIKEKGLVQITDTAAIEAIVRKAIEENPGQWQEFKSGKAQLRGFFVGQIMKNSGGKANPSIVNRMLDELI